MKKFILLLLLPLTLMLFISCVDEHSFNPDKETDSQKLEKATSLVTTADYQVPIVDGYITTVSYNGMMLARTSTPLSIKVPKDAVSRGDDNLDITYSEGQAAQSYSNLWQTILFEDSKDGDNDYNDIVIHANYQIEGNKLKVRIQPIALGSTKDIKLCFKWKQGGSESKVVVVAENCRADLFDGRVNFINSRVYNKHYPKFVKEFTMELPNASDVVDISWFIKVDKQTLIYAVNQNSDKCIDENGMPFGFALTDVTKGATVKNSLKGKQNTKAMADANDWDSVKPNSNWAFMTPEPSVPDRAIELKGGEILQHNNYVIKKDNTLKIEYLGGKAKKTTVYVQGSLIVTKSMWGSEYEIVVLKGGTLEIPAMTMPDDVTILNYGTLKFSGGFDLVINRGTTIKSMSNLNIPTELQVVGELYCAGELEVGKFSVGVKGRAYMNSLKADYINIGQGLLYSNGAITANNIEVNNGGIVYADCSMNIRNQIVISNNKSSISVKGHISAQELAINNKSSINIMSGGLIEISKITAGDTKVNEINVVGQSMGVLAVKDMHLWGELSLKKVLKGYMGVNVSQVYNTNIPVELEDVTLPNNDKVIFNSNKITLAPTECLENGYNTVSNDDNGLAWFAYPLEGVSIELCYDFEAWKLGNITFKKLPTAQVFDVNNDQPIEGGKHTIYQVTE
ncbi:MAG: hypothetical protein RSB34_00580 [Muribaculaceae bacterium]